MLFVLGAKFWSWYCLNTKQQRQPTGRDARCHAALTRQTATGRQRPWDLSAISVIHSCGHHFCSFNRLMAATTAHLRRARRGQVTFWEWDNADAWEIVLEIRHVNHRDANEFDMQLIKYILTKLFHCLLLLLTWLDLNWKLVHLLCFWTLPIVLFLLKSQQCFGDWILSPSSCGIYSAGLNQGS
jgi:hypothetical protein